jgi:hypothetical protein
VDWHPVNAHVESEPDTRLEGAMFPMFGSLVESPPPSLDIHGGTVRGGDISMFDASKIVGAQLSHILNKSGDISSLLESHDNRRVIREKTRTQGICSDSNLIDETLQRLWVSYSAYSLHKARNIYNDAYATWWLIAGKAWYDIQLKEVEY